MRVPILAGLALWIVLWSAGAHLQGPPRDLPPGPEPGRPVVIDLPEPPDHARPLELATGEPLSFRQEPPLLLPREDHGMRLVDFTVAGDVPRVRFDRWNPETGADEQETWERERTDTIDGRLVSIFQPSWSADVIQRRLTRARVGLDRPFVYLGSFRGSADNPDVELSVNLRVGTSLAHPVEIVRIDDTVQYSSHVVNLVVPGFGNARFSTDFELQAAARKFFEHFEDSYEVLAVVPQATHMAEYAAYHRTVRNEVDGIGIDRIRRSAAYGSAATLLGVEVYPNVWLTDNGVSNHELTHTWSHDFDWSRIAGISRPPDVGAHAPLMTGGESMVSAVLFPNLRVVRRGDGPAVVERIAEPARQHPLDLYAMGLLEPGDVPEWEVFEDQDQLGDEAPAVGREVTGAARRVSINDVMAAHGPRRGPVLSSLSRATILVSRDELASPEEMAYWNFFAARLEDPTGSGVLSYEGQPSFDVTTDRRIDLRTDIRPKATPRIGQPHDVDPMTFGTSDCRDVEFTQPPRARVRVGERFTVAGRVTARDRTDFDQVLVRLWPGTGDQSRVERASREISRSGEFSVDIELRDGREGQYLVEVFLFWPGAGSQYARCTLSPVVVSPPAR